MRDWLYVEDHAIALLTVLTKGTVGQTYNIGGNNEQSNLEVVKRICQLLDELRPISNNPSFMDHPDSPKCYADLISFVKDRPGHDLRYAINAEKISKELDWQPSENFDSGFRKTIQWYLDNQTWWERCLSGEYKLQRQGIG